jgi:CHAT domain-containing protein
MLRLFFLLVLALSFAKPSAAQNDDVILKEFKQLNDSSFFYLENYLSPHYFVLMPPQYTKFLQKYPNVHDSIKARVLCMEGENLRHYRKNKEATVKYDSAIMLLEKCGLTETPQYYFLMTGNGIDLASGNETFDSGIEMLTRALRFFLKELPPNHVYCMNTLKNLATFYERRKMTEKAIENLKIAAENARTSENVLVQIRLLHILCDLSFFEAKLQRRRNQDIENEIKNLLDKQLIDIQRPELIQKLAAIGTEVSKRENYPLADAIFKNVLVQTEKYLQTEDKIFNKINVMSYYATYLHESDQLEKAENIYYQLIDFYERGNHYFNLINTRLSLADVYTQRFEYDKALQQNKICEPLIYQHFGKNTVQEYSVKRQKAMAYLYLGIYELAAKNFTEALEILKVLGYEKTPNASQIHNELAICSEKTGDYKKSLEHYELSLAIDESIGNKNTDYFKTFINRAVTLRNKRDSLRCLQEAAKAVKLFEDDLLAQKNPLHSYAVMVYSQNLAFNNKWDSAYIYAEKAAEISNLVFGGEHMVSVFAKMNFTQMMLANKKIKDAVQKADEVLTKRLQNIERSYAVMTEEERKQFMRNNSRFFEIYCETMLAGAGIYSVFPHQENPNSECKDKLLNFSLITKGLVLSASNKVKARIFASKDETLIRDFVRWQKIKEDLAKMLAQKEKPAEADSLERAARELELMLSERSSEFKKTFDPPVPSWQEVKKVLKKGEYAVDIIRTRSVKGYIYFASIISSKSDHPEIVMLSEEIENFEGKKLKFYKNCIQYKLLDTLSYVNFWEKINQKLPDAKRVFVSPDGVYNQINPETLYDAKNKKYVADMYGIVLLSNLRELLMLGNQKRFEKYETAILYGNPKFNLGKKTDKKADTDTERTFAFGSITMLPGTKKETEEITEILKKSGFSVHSYMDENANEENIKKINSPQILHIATHGFFLQDKKKGDPMLRSGILLAGAEDFDFSAERKEDGILTAYEAALLSLDNTEMVVLSACETGVGETEAGEGVYGLQRALKVAGAKSVLMSLWKVDDVATQKLMVYFYNELIKTKDKAMALKNAKAKLRTESTHPYYWGAFVLNGL